VYRQPGSRAPRRRIAIGVVAVTAALAFALAIVALTTVDLVSGGSVGKGSGRTTFFSGPDRDRTESPAAGDDQTEQQPEEPAGETRTAPPATETTPTEPQSDTAPVPPPTDLPPAEPAPETTP
jgi:outer membrane biosynthesis protein TonB